jgi:hypothetical protein
VKFRVTILRTQLLLSTLYLRMQVTRESTVHGTGMVFTADVNAGGIFFKETAFAHGETIPKVEEQTITVEMLHEYGMTLGDTVEDLVNRYVHRLSTLTGLKTGFGMFGTMGLVNHSCAPNTAQFFTADGVCWLVATRPCKKDEEVFMSYCPNLSAMPVVNRRMSFKERYEFWCTCERCIREDSEYSYEQQPQYVLPRIEKFIGVERCKALVHFMVNTSHEEWVFDKPAPEILDIILKVYKFRSLLKRFGEDIEGRKLIMGLVTETVEKMCRLAICRMPKLLESCKRMASVLQEALQPPYSIFDAQGCNNMHLVTNIFLVSFMCLRTQKFPHCFLQEWVMEQNAKYSAHFRLAIYAESRIFPHVLEVLEDLK